MQRGVRFFEKKNDSHAASRSFWAAGVAPAAGHERSHAAWRSFLSKIVIPMLRGARSGPRGWRQLALCGSTGPSHDVGLVLIFPTCSKQL